LLRLSGYEVLNAATLTEGQALLADSPDCVILDLMLPDGNGTDLLSYVRAHHLPISVVVTTGAIDWSTTLSPPNATPDVIFPKPVDYRQLVTWLDDHCWVQ
jgi:DNA-binding response OmpR family regulator